MCVCKSEHTCESQFYPYTVCVLRIDLRFLDLAASHPYPPSYLFYLPPQYYLIVVLIGISLMSNKVDKLRCFTYMFICVLLFKYSSKHEAAPCLFCLLMSAMDTFVLLPEVVAGDEGLIGVLVIQAAEAVPGLTVMGPAVQVTIPVDLNTHDSSLGAGGGDS